MEFSEYNWAMISETICPQMLIFGKQASWTLFFQNILTNPIISEISFFMTSSLQYSINIVSSVFSLTDCTLEKRLSTQENRIQVQFQRALIALNHKPIFADKKVIICALRFIQFVVYSMRNSVVYRTLKKVVFC